MAQQTAPGRTNLGPGFWPVTIGLTVLNLAISAYIIWVPLGQFLPEAAFPSDRIDDLFKFMAVFGNAIFIYVTGYLVYFCIVWRRRKDEPLTAIGIQVHDNPTLELWWTIIPTILVIILAIFSVQIWTSLQTNPAGGLAVEAIGHQFYFEFRYPNLKDSIQTVVNPGYPVPAPVAADNEFAKDDIHTLHLPVDTPVTIYVTSVDVIHSFWIPEIRLKADMVPGNVQPIRFQPTQTGLFRIVCAQFCGGLHGQMYGYVKVDSKEDYAKWIAGIQDYQTKKDAANSVAVSPTSGDAAKGKTDFGVHCTGCHNAGADFEGKIVGPGLLHLTDNLKHPHLVTGDDPTPENIAALLKSGYSGPDKSAEPEQPPIGGMPNADGNGLSPKDIADLTAYLVTLK